MTDKVLCPWCGSEMEIRYNEYDMDEYLCWSECTNGACMAEGPSIARKNYDVAVASAKAAALRRYEPPVRPLTWDEFVQMAHPRLDGTAYPPVFVETAKAYSRRCGSWVIASPKAIRVDNRYKPPRAFVDAHRVNLDSMNYNKTWRCWPRKPTEEEREACGWEDDMSADT